MLALLAAAADPARAAGGRGRHRPPPADPFCALHFGACIPPPYVTVMSAFPAELEPLLAEAHVTETIATGDRTCHVGKLAGVRVVLVRAGIGLVNAATTTRAVLDRFQVSAIVFSGVAGSRLDIGDVAAPAEWSDGTASFPVGASLLAVAQTLASPPVPLERCTPVPPDPPGPRVCLDHPPRIVAGGSGESADPFGGRAFPCTPGGGPIFGCEALLAGPLVPDALPPDAMDMETAAVARVAGDAGVPYVAFRGVSDGSGDPLGLPGFPAQFFAYYRLAAENAAAVTTAFLAASNLSDTDRADRARGRRATSRRPRVAAACDWERAASPACAGERAPRAIKNRVARACRLLAKAAAATPGSAAARMAERWERKSWQRAARLLQSGRQPGLASDCRLALVGALEARAAAP